MGRTQAGHETRPRVFEAMLLTVGALGYEQATVAGGRRITRTRDRRRPQLRRVERLLPDLAHLVVLNYFGEDEAWLELRSTDGRHPGSEAGPSRGEPPLRANTSPFIQEVLR